MKNRERNCAYCNAKPNAKVVEHGDECPWSRFDAALPTAAELRMIDYERRAREAVARAFV